MRILRTPQNRAFCNPKIMHHTERKALKQTDGRTIKICMHHTTFPDPCMNNGDGCGIYKAQKGEQINERRTTEQ